MTKDEIYTIIKNILIDEFGLDPGVISPEASLETDLDLDSIDAVDLIVKLKEYTTKRIDPELFKNVRVLGDVVDIIVPLAQAH
jgi:acyl carrier protein